MKCLRQPQRQVSSCSGQFVDDFDARQVGGQRFAFAPALGRGNDFFVTPIGDRNRETFGLIKERELRMSWAGKPSVAYRR